MEEGLSGASFFSSRRLSKPFSRGEWAGLPLGDDGSCGWWVDSREFFGGGVVHSSLRSVRRLLVKLLRTSLETSTTRLSSLFSPSLSCNGGDVSMGLNALGRIKHWYVSLLGSVSEVVSAKRMM